MLVSLGQLRNPSCRSPWCWALVRLSRILVRHGQVLAQKGYAERLAWGLGKDTCVLLRQR